MTTLRRFLVLAAIAFWLGGFTFYVSVVVPVGTDVLGSAMQQGLITRRVTAWLNLAGACALVPLSLDALTDDRSAWRHRARLALWALVAVCQAALFVLHRHLDAMIDPEEMTVSDPAAFYRLHRAYLWLHTAQWFAALAFIVLTLKAWQGQDEGRAGQPAEDLRLADPRGPQDDRMTEKEFRR